MRHWEPPSRAALVYPVGQVLVDVTHSLSQSVKGPPIKGDTSTARVSMSISRGLSHLSHCRSVTISPSLYDLSDWIVGV